ncbi:interleukin-6 receptor subunit alpha isoform X2 [Sardina pilchardus]|uniref:interleukin-6 receptor subunit alpha isoform X2 n=1 Tax=Sardina pilchardus TaxID=27697 RepID=UPI002E12E3BA
MRIWTKFASLWSILVVAEVQCTQCNVTWTEPLHDLHDALVVIPGSEVVIGCCGDVSLDGVLMVRGTCPGVQGSDSGQITTENILLSTNHGSDTVDSLETNQLEGGTDYKAGSDSSEMDNGSQWMLNGQPVQGNAGMGWNLMLPSFGLADAGNYSCHRAGRWMSTVRMDLANSPERPTLTCRRKDLYKRKIRCDWKASRPINPAPKCHLILHKLMSQEQRVSSCRYSPKRSRCRCLLEPEALDTDSIWYAARLSVRSTSGCGTSRWIDFTPQSILKPDPPVSVNVRSVDGQERTLDVFWSYPTSWRTRRGTYLLKFELRYYPVLGKMNQTVAIPRTSPRLSWRISDALAGVQYAVQIRSMEEHGQGSWSDWSSAVYAHTWIAPKPTESSDISEDPLILLVIPGTTPGSDAVGRPPPIDDGFLLVHMVSIMGCCVLVIIFVLVFVQVIRHKIHFKSELQKLAVTPPPPVPPLQLSPCKAKVQHCPPVSSLPQETPHDPSPAQDLTKDVHFQNMSYFLMSLEPKS